ncbi:hypothetical protein L3Y34_000137 [Caenorhabditis briggsae]|uniref:Major sperm protein n=1 Tax=Caenorhabditis briggsae TaxID=6238 RepID=A0AAE9IL48_CAEBR|nr:hypothetical protein L3Y34_000137 [Caenorhabditis briggsae]
MSANTPKPKKNVSSEPRTAHQKKRRSREEEKSTPCYISNDGYLWTDINPDLALIEPRILVSVNFNYLAFSRKQERPPESRSLALINHGDYPVAFKIETTDNYSYFVDCRNGIIPPRQTVVNAAVRMPNIVTIEVYHRPHNEYLEEDKQHFYNRPRKDKLFILLAPQMCQTFAPEAIFHNERSYEKLRVMLMYSGVEEKPGETAKKQLLLGGVVGWCTWKEDNGARKEKNDRQIAEFRKIEKTIIQNASKEQCEDNPRMTSIHRKSPAIFRSKTPVLAGPAGQRRPGMSKQFRSVSPFNRTPTIKKTQSETPKKLSNEGAATPVARTAASPFKTSLENQKTPANQKKMSGETPRKGSHDAPSPSLRGMKKSTETKNQESETRSPSHLKKPPTPTKEVASPKVERKSQEAPVPAASPNHKESLENWATSSKPDANSQ